MRKIETLGIIGDPVAHSLSPVMHAAALRALDYPDVYTRWQTSSDELPARVKSLREVGMRGANVTLPHKVAVVALIDRLKGVAQKLGAVNTIVREDDGSLTGYNTDAPGFKQSLEALGWQPAIAIILGAGGAARAALQALEELGCPEVHILNRTPDKAAQLVYLPHQYTWSLSASNVPELMRKARLVINATSLGWHDPDPLPIDSVLLHSNLLVYDMVYRETALLKAAKHVGAQTIDGADMLVRQAALAFELWFNTAAPLEVMRTALYEALGRDA